MPFSFVRIVVPGRPATKLYQVRERGRAGRLIGSVTEEHGGLWRASTVVAGKLRTREFRSRQGATAWLLRLRRPVK